MAVEMEETILDVRVGDVVKIGDDVVMQVQAHFSGRQRTHNKDEVKFVIAAPQSMRIHRSENQSG